MKTYIYENPKEFDRQERLALSKSYDIEAELKDFSPKPDGMILDAGCGSGAVARYFAEIYPQAKVIGCDFSEQRIAQASNYIKTTKNEQHKNLNFKMQNILKLNFDPNSIDAVNCRYVLQGMNSEESFKALEEFYRCMKPGGRLSIIDIDGLIYNMFPRTTVLKNGFAELSRLDGIDFNVGRKIPHLVKIVGFRNMKWKIDTLQFCGDSLQDEKKIVKERFDMMMPTLAVAMGGEQKALQFVHEYMTCLEKPGATLFYNKFIITAEKVI